MEDAEARSGDHAAVNSSMLLVEPATVMSATMAGTRSTLPAPPKACKATDRVSYCLAAAADLGNIPGRQGRARAARQ